MYVTINLSAVSIGPVVVNPPVIYNVPFAKTAVAAALAIFK